MNGVVLPGDSTAVLAGDEAGAAIARLTDSRGCGASIDYSSSVCIVSE